MKIQWPDVRQAPVRHLGNSEQVSRGIPDSTAVCMD
jgi:hypothetical protein